MKLIRITPRVGAGLSVVLVLVLLGYGGSGVRALGAPRSYADATPIANCIVDNRNDVVIGGVKAKADCKGAVVMAPGRGNPDYYREILVSGGGELLVTAGTGGSERANEPPVSIVCIGNGGTVRAGNKDNPVDNQNRFRMTFVGMPGDKDSDSNSPCYGFSKGIDVTAGGKLLLYGAEGVPEHGGVSWTTLAAPAGTNMAGAKMKTTGTRTLHLTADVTQGAAPWQHGDWIVVATTTYTPFETEFVRIDTVESDPNGGSVVTLLEPLKFYHFGSPPPSPVNASCTNAKGRTEAGFLCDGAGRNFGVDERAEVGLVSRDVELTADTATAANRHWGGEIMIHQGFAQAVIQGVRISKFGKDQLGSYPIHFHKVGDADNRPVIDADSVDHSFNKCVTIHETSNLTIENLVCARIVGHIFYEELGSWNEQNEAADSGIVFKDDLGLGAMSNSFDINGPLTGKDGQTWTRQELIDTYWWPGDYMTNAQCASNCIHYDGFNIPDTDNQAQYVRGSCTTFLANGSFGGYVDPNPGPAFKACSDRTEKVYIEPATGFWIQNPDTQLLGNAIAGCQGVGRAYWWVTPGAPIQVKNSANVDLKFQPFGPVRDDRASACFAGFYDEPEGSVHAEQLFPRAGGKLDSPPVVARLEGITATRNRYRGVWLRPSWFALDHAHLASNMLDVTLVTSGGLDGNYPGVWELLENSVVAGITENNVERWGPCPVIDELGQFTGGQNGCIDHTPGGSDAHSAEEMANGYPTPYRNAFGYMIYDGPVRIFHDRFVNFNYNESWTQTAAQSGGLPCRGDGWELYSELDLHDCAFLQEYERTHVAPAATAPVPKPWIPSPYEGDAAFGWFDSNQSAYPTATASKDLMWTNTDLRHQIFTRYVTLNTNFNDGDKNTAVIDEDGSLDGLGVMLAPNSGSSPVHPISLNNLPINGTSNSVDECLSRGGQNAVFEARDSSLMSPTSMGTLEFFDLYPFLVKTGEPPVEKWTCTDLQSCIETYPGVYPDDNNTHWQDMTFTRDDPVPASGTVRPAMTLYSRNGQGVWEPKLSNGYGYTVSVKPSTSPEIDTPRLRELRESKGSGIWSWIDVGFTDVVDPNISTQHPFFVRLGICYSNRDGSHPQGSDIFTIKRGYKSWGNNAANVWKGDPILQQNWTEYLKCHDLDTQDPNYVNVPVWANGGLRPAGCPAGPPSAQTTLQPAASIAELGTSTRPNLKKYYYNPATGMLYLNVAQVLPNADGPSPSGSCANGNHDPSCPTAGESYYACPKIGCPIYTIAMKRSVAASYKPGASSCRADPQNLMAPPPATDQNKLVVYGTDTEITPELDYDLEGQPYHKAANGPACPATTMPP